MAQQERAVRTRSAVLEAAAAVFAERGYQAATIADILDRGEITKGALYFHFVSKEDLARGVLEHAVSTDGVPDQRSKLQEFVDAGMVLAHRMPRDPMLAAAARLVVDQSLGDFFGGPWPDWTKLLAQLLAEGKAQGEVLPFVVPADTAHLVVGAFTGLQLLSQAQTGMADLEQRISTMYEHLLPGIAVPSVLARLQLDANRGASAYAEAHTRDATPTTDTHDTRGEHPGTS